ncbi:accessory gene regulator B family protein [Desulforamulus profundi]|uniref:accessory gene regulator ArgB-like protein n=1 Tax=Desulforamulus profundi TaxID=1383067 RepID=UPI0030830AA7
MWRSGFFGLVSSIVITCFLGYLFHLHVQIFYMLLASMFIRKTAGGAHSENSLHCLLITVFIYNILAYIALETIYIVQDYMGLVIILSFLYGLTIIYLKAPVESPEKPLSFQQKKLLRKLSFLAVFFLFICQGLSYIYNKYELTNYAVSLIMLWQYLMLTSFGHKIMYFIDRFLLIILLKGR